MGKWLGKDRRYAGLESLHCNEPLDVLEVGTSFQMRHHSPGARFRGGSVRVPANVLRVRSPDVLSPGDLGRKTYGSFVTAWQAKADHHVFRPAFSGGLGPSGAVSRLRRVK